MLITASRPVLGIAAGLVFLALICTRHSSVMASSTKSVHERDAHPDFASNGPYSFAAQYFTLTVDGAFKKSCRGTSTSTSRHLTLTVTLPNGGKDLDGATEGPFPVVFLFNGFMLRASFYKTYAQRLASWGYAVVQYDTGMFPILTTAAELTFLPQIMSWAQQQEQLGSRLDLGCTAVVGHSRGGQLAALHLGEGTPGLRTAFLIDPVDNTKAAPESTDYPSAARALQRAGKPVAVAGASIFGSCNPNGSNWKHFYPSLMADSWLAVIEGASHGDFQDAGFLRNKLFDALCKSGRISNQATIELTMPVMLAWLELHLRGDQQKSSEPDSQQSKLSEFFKWLQMQTAAGKITFRVKAAPDHEKEQTDPAPHPEPTVTQV